MEIKMKIKTYEAAQRVTLVVLIIVAFLEGLVLSFTTQFVATPILCLITALFFYAVYCRMRRKALERRDLVIINTVIFAAGILHFFTLHAAVEVIFWVALAPVQMFVFYSRRWSPLYVILYFAVFAALLFLPEGITGISFSKINVRLALLLVAMLPVFCVPVIFIFMGEIDKGRSVKPVVYERDILNALAELFYRVRASWHTMKAVSQMMGGQSSLDSKDQQTAREMLDETATALSDMMNGFFVSSTLSNEPDEFEPFNLSARIQDRVASQFMALGIEETPIYSFDPSIPWLVEGDTAYFDRALERIISGVLYDNLMAHELMAVNTLILGAPKNDTILVQVKFACGSTLKSISQEDTPISDNQLALFGTLRIRRSARGVSASFSIPFIIATKMKRSIDVVEVAKMKPPIIPADGTNLLAKANILIVDGDAVNQRALGANLQGLVGSIASAENGEEAVELVRKNRYNLIVMDVQLPGMDGYAATMAIREIEKARGAHVPVIALMSYALRGDRERCVAAGMDTYLVKPFQRETLLALMARELAKQQ